LRDRTSIDLRLRVRSMMVRRISDFLRLPRDQFVFALRETDLQ
jgi:hypothetical protein